MRETQTPETPAHANCRSKLEAEMQRLGLAQEPLFLCAILRAGSSVPEGIQTESSGPEHALIVPLCHAPQRAPGSSLWALIIADRRLLRTQLGMGKEGSDPNSTGRLQIIFSVTRSPRICCGSHLRVPLNRLGFVL